MAMKYPSLEFSSKDRRRLFAGSIRTFLAAGLLSLGFAVSAAAQTTTVIPNTISTIGFNTPSAATTAGTACPTNPQFKATDAYGNGCPAVNAIFNTGDADTGITTDQLGNVYISNNTNNPQMVRKIDLVSGNISMFTGQQAVSCSGGVTINGTTYTPIDKHGDGCPAIYGGQFNNIAGLGSDPYGNIFFNGLGDNLVHMICQAVSPICSPAAVKVNLLTVVAGCTSGAANSGTATAGITPGTAGDGSAAAQTASCTAGVSAPGGGITADAWDNVYFLDQTGGTTPRVRVVAGPASATINGVSVTNPLYAALTAAGYTGVSGNIYPMVGGGTVCAAKTDTVGDGCLFTQTVVGAGNRVQGMVVDNEGDFIYTDGTSTKQSLHVVYMGGQVIKAAILANNTVSGNNPVIGTTYILMGTGAASTSFFYYNTANPGIVKGNTRDLQNNVILRLAKDPAGNIYVGDQIQILFYDIATGYVRRIATTNGAAVCSGANVVGDGCPITQSFFGKTSTALGVAFDPQGNLFIDDTNFKFIRKVTATSLPTTAVNGTQNSSLIVHSPVASSTVTITGATSAEFTFGTAAHVTNADNSVDTTVAVAFKPLAVGRRTDALTIATTASATTTNQISELYGNATGSALVFDVAGTPTTATLGATATGNTAVAVDGNGNTYVSGTQGISKFVGSTVTNISATSAAYIAVDPAGNVYAAAASGSSITKYIYNAASNTYTASTVTLPPVVIGGTSTPITSGPISVDTNGTIYLIDSTSKQLVRFNQITGILDNATQTAQQVTQTAFSAPSALSQDYYGNLLVVDGTNIYKIPSVGFPVSSTAAVSNGIAAYPTANPAVTYTTALVAPTSVTSDPAGNIYVAASGGAIVALSINGGYQYTIPNFTGTSIAADGNGNLFATTSTVAGITQLQRNAQSNAFGTSSTTPITGVFLNAGTSASTGFAQSNASGDFIAGTPTSPLAPAGAPVCNLTTTALAFGALCNTQLNFTGGSAGTGPVTDVITFLPTPNTIGNLTLTGTKTGANATTTTAITGNTTGLVYSPGTETTFTVTVSQSTGGAPTGNVNVTIDGSNAVISTSNCTVSTPGIATCALTAATATTSTATVTVAGLSAGANQTIFAAYPGATGIGASTSSTITFSIAQASTTTTFNPGSTTQQFSAPIGNAVLNATAASGSTNVPGVFVYTAAGQEVHAASYLARGTYVLGVTFYPTDSTNYTTSTATATGYTVTQATTTAGIGATQNVVGPAGNANANYQFTANASSPGSNALQTAIQTLSSTNGGNVYVLPGTYTGNFTVNAPNVSLRGLGGDPTSVVLTHSLGAFSPSGSGAYTGEFTAAYTNNGYTGDEGSATLVVARGAIPSYAGGATLTPYGFYGENLTLQNTYNFDATTTTTYSATSGGTCVAGNAIAYSYAYLYNSNQQCASQALAIWNVADQSVFNNVYFNSGQDTIYAGSVSTGGALAARQLYFRGKVTGNIDYIFGDAAAVFDRTSIYTTYHRSQTGNATIGAQNKAALTGSVGDYLSGYVFNSNVFTSQSSGMTSLYFARPYGVYSTQVFLNSYIDQVNSAGYEEFSGQTNLPTSTYAEYNNSTYTDPATNANDLNGVPYLGTGGSTGTGVTSTRETTSTNPGTIMVAASGFQTKYTTLANTTLANFEAQQYYPLAFLGKTVPSNPYNNGVTSWDHTAAIAAKANAFVSGGVTSVAFGTPVTILMRPQTPGVGAITNGNYTVPTGTYTLSDGSTQLATGTLDASGEAFYTATNLAVGAHNLTWSYGGDANFAASTTGTAYVVTVNTAPTTTTLTPATQTITYGQSVSLTATVAPSASTGTVSLFVDGAGTAAQTVALSGGTASFTVTGLLAGAHTFTATYNGSANYATSSSTSVSATVNKAVITVTGTGVNRQFNAPNSISHTTTGYQYSDNAATVFTSGPSQTTTATRDSVAGTYTVVPTGTLTAFGSANYTLSLINGSFTITGGTPQFILFAPLPNFPAGTYQLSARTTSGLPVTYAVTAGNASVSGTALTVTGTGTVTVQASTATDPTGDYAVATPVSRSFTAQ